MDQQVELHVSLAGGPEERATRLNEHLELIHNYLEHDKATARRLSFKVQSKNQGDKNRILNFASYSGPDDETLDLLEHCAGKWWDEPLQFWDYSHHDSSACFDPQTQIFKAFLQTKRDHA